MKKVKEEVSYFPLPLSAEEEELYLNRHITGDTEATKILVERNLRLVAYLSKKYLYMNDNISIDEFISIGVIGLIKGVNTYNPQKKTKLSTYLSKCIQNEILMALRFFNKLNSSAVISLEEVIGIDKDGCEMTIAEKVIDTSEKSVEDLTITNDLMDKLNKMIQVKLNPMEQTVVRYRYLSNEQYTQNKIAEKLHLSRSYISRIEKRALRKLRKGLENA